MFPVVYFLDGRSIFWMAAGHLPHSNFNGSVASTYFYVLRGRCLLICSSRDQGKLQGLRVVGERIMFGEFDRLSPVPSQKTDEDASQKAGETWPNESAAANQIEPLAYDCRSNRKRRALVAPSIRANC